MISCPITLWQIDGGKLEIVLDFTFLSSKITVDGVRALTNLDSILKSRDLTLPIKVHLVKTMVFFQQSCMDVRVPPLRKLSA